MHSTTGPHAPTPTHSGGGIITATYSLATVARNKQTKIVVKNRIQRSKNVSVWCHVVGDRVERVYDMVVGEGRRMVRWGIIIW